MSDHKPDRRGRISFIIPTYNEAPIIVGTIRQVQAWAARTNRHAEIIVADDGTDGLDRRLVEAGLEGVAAYVRGPQLGKGAAVREGILRSTEDVIAYCDADLPLADDDMERCIRAVEQGEASYAVPERSWTFHGPVRTVASVVLWLMQCVVVFRGPAFFDTQCGFKVFRRDLAVRLARDQISDGGMFDVEYLYRSTTLCERVFRLRVQQKPEIRPSRIRVLRCLVRDPIDLLRIRASMNARSPAPIDRDQHLYPPLDP